MKQAIVTLGSSITLTTSGGPNSWAAEPGNFIAELVPEQPELVQIEGQRSPTGCTYSLSKKTIFIHPFTLTRPLLLSMLAGTQRRQYNIKCLNYGSQMIQVRIGNLPSSSNPLPVVQTETLEFICERPASVYVHAVLPRPTPETLEHYPDQFPEECVEGMLT